MCLNKQISRELHALHTTGEFSRRIVQSWRSKGRIMLRPNFQQIEEETEKNYLKYVGLYRMDDMVS